MPSTHLALLRGINVGGKNKLPMKDLVKMFVESGCGGVANYIQSGNIMFTATPTLAARLSERIAAQIRSRFAYDVPVILRTVGQLAKVVSSNPFFNTGADENHLHVMFLADAPYPERIRTLDPGRSAPDQFAVHGQEVYLRLPNGAGRSKLTNQYFDSRLATVSTARNWRTVTKLLELMR